MRRLKPDVDIVLDILKVVASANPENTFAQSILYQYQERGGLSKKQLEGLYGKAKSIKEIPQNKLATLEAIILKKPVKEKALAPKTTRPLYEKDPVTGKLIDEILAKHPLHKRVLYLRAKYEDNNPLSAAETAELEKFSKLLK
jgi:hypothetical protein